MAWATTCWPSWALLGTTSGIPWGLEPVQAVLEASRASALRAGLQRGSKSGPVAQGGQQVVGKQWETRLYLSITFGPYRWFRLWHCPGGRGVNPKKIRGETRKSDPKPENPKRAKPENHPKPENLEGPNPKTAGATKPENRRRRRMRTSENGNSTKANNNLYPFWLSPSGPSV